MASIKTVDIIIPTYKPDSRFIRLLELIMKQTYPVSKVIVINTGKQFYDLFMEGHRNPIPADKYQLIHILESEFDHGNTRRTAVDCSESDYFVMMTQDAIPYDESLVEKLIEAFDLDSQIAISYARQLPAQGAKLTERFVRDFNYPEASKIKAIDDLDELGIKTFFCSDVCAAYDRAVYDSLGGFIDKAIFNEDMIYASKAVRAGYKISYTAGAKVFHSHNYSAKEQFHRNFDLAVSQADHPEVFGGLPSEGEGMRLVKDCIDFLVKKHRAYLIPGFIINCGGRFLGFKLGKKYKVLPRGFVLWASSNKTYWK